MQARSQVKSAQSIDKNVIIFAVMILFVLPLALMILQVDDDGFPAIESWPAIWSTPLSPWNPLLLQVTSGVFVLIMVTESLRSHIGEKRFDNRTIEYTKSIMIKPGWRRYSN